MTDRDTEREEVVKAILLSTLEQCGEQELTNTEYMALIDAMVAASSNITETCWDAAIGEIITFHHVIARIETLEEKLAGMDGPETLD